MSENVSSLSSSSAGGSSLQTTPFVDRGAPLSDGYGETRIVLLPRDPHWMYTYWEVTEKSAQEIKSKFGADIFARAQATVRMHEVSLEVQSLNAQLPTPNSIRFMDVAVSLDTKNWYLRADKENSSWFVELGLKTPDGKFISIAKSNVVRLPSGKVSEMLDEKWVTIKEELEKALEASGGGKVGMGSLEFVRMVAQRWEMLSQISSWRGSGGISSFRGEMGARAAERGFWLVADCELILYGATEPTATVTVAGKPVELFPDGSFSLRFALPDGRLALPVKAVSGDRLDEREIKISVERKTAK